MFRDRLPGHRRVLRQLRDRARCSLAQPGKEREPADPNMQLNSCMFRSHSRACMAALPL